MIEVRAVSAEDFFAISEAATLTASYYEECANQTIGSFGPDKDRYVSLEKQGLLHVAGAFDGGRLVGFVSVITVSVPHYKGAVLAIVESIYLEEARREGANGLKLLNWAREAARKAGAKGLYVSAVAGSRLEKLALILGRHANTVVFLEGVCS